MRSFRVIGPAIAGPGWAAGPGEAGAGHTRSDQVIQTAGPAPRRRSCGSSTHGRPGQEQESLSP